jgi:hypothetical protein
LALDPCSERYSQNCKVKKENGATHKAFAPFRFGGHALIQEKASDSVLQVMQEVRTLVAQKLPQIAELFAAKATDGNTASVTHAKFLLELLDWQAPVAAEKKTKTERATSEQTSGDDPFYGQLMKTLEKMVSEAESKAAAEAGTVK